MFPSNMAKVISFPLFPGVYYIYEWMIIAIMIIAWHYVFHRDICHIKMLILIVLHQKAPGASFYIVYSQKFSLFHNKIPQNSTK